MKVFNFSAVLIAVVIFALDFSSKFLTHAHLPVMSIYTLTYPYGGIGVFQQFFGIEFSISHQVNYGAAWGMFSEYQIYLLYLRIALIFGLIGYAAFCRKHLGKGIPLALIIAGAAGNIVDYFMYGHVVDMLHFVLWGYDFPVFNVADSAIFIGIVSWVLLSGYEKEVSAQP